MFAWEGVTEFVAVAETESFTQAAKRLGISTAQVSRQVSALERRLATKLFHRTTRKVSATEAGQVYFEHCRQVLDGLQEAERAITHLQSAPRGKLRITAPVTYGEKTIAPLVNDFLLSYPEVEVELTLTNRTLDLVAEGYDVAVRMGEPSMYARRPSTWRAGERPAPYRSSSITIVCRATRSTGVFWKARPPEAFASKAT